MTKPERDYPRDDGKPTLRWLQENLPWTIPYAPHFEAAAYPMDRVKHDVLHVMKSLGRIAAECENHDHGRDRKLTGKALGKEVADLVICALHIAKLEHFDLEDAVIDSSGVRNGVDLRGALDAPRSETEAPKQRSLAPIYLRLKQQRDECAEALRECVLCMENKPNSTHPYELVNANKALAKVPTYEQQLRNIAEGLGLDYDEMIANLSNKVAHG